MWKRYPRSDLGKTRQTTFYPARGAYRGYQLRYGNFPLDKTKQTCYYTSARLVPPLLGPAPLGSPWHWEKNRPKGRFFFCPLPAPSDAIFCRVSLRRQRHQTPATQAVFSTRIYNPKKVNQALSTT